MKIFCFSAVFLILFIAFTFNLFAAVKWDLVDEDFKTDGDFGAFTTVEHTGADRIAESSKGFAILQRVKAGADIGPTIRAYFDDPQTNEFIMYAKINTKEVTDGHFILCMRISGFEYFPTLSDGKINDHEMPEQYNTGIGKIQVKADIYGTHEYIIVGKSDKAYDFYMDGKLIIQDGITRSLGGSDWEIAQAMIHVRKGVDVEIHVDAVRVKKGITDIRQIIAVEPEGKLALTWGKVKEL